MEYPKTERPKRRNTVNVNNRIAGEALSLNPGTVDAVALQVERFGDVGDHLF